MGDEETWGWASVLYSFTLLIPPTYLSLITSYLSYLAVNPCIPLSACLYFSFPLHHHPFSLSHFPFCIPSTHVSILVQPSLLFSSPASLDLLKLNHIYIFIYLAICMSINLRVSIYYLSFHHLCLQSVTSFSLPAAHHRRSWAPPASERRAGWLSGLRDSGVGVGLASNPIHADQT